MTKIQVDYTLCKGHSQCEQVAPELFEVREGNDGYQSFPRVADVDANNRALLEQAVRRCPTEALSIVD